MKENADTGDADPEDDEVGAALFGAFESAWIASSLVGAVMKGTPFAAPMVLGPVPGYLRATMYCLESAARVAGRHEEFLEHAKRTKGEAVAEKLRDFFREGEKLAKLAARYVREALEQLEALAGRGVADVERRGGDTAAADAARLDEATRIGRAVLRQALAEVDEYLGLVEEARVRAQAGK